MGVVVLLKNVLEDFHQAYWRHRADLEMRCLKQNFCSFMQDFIEPMKRFVDDVEQCKKVMVEDAKNSSIKTHVKTPQSLKATASGRSKAVVDGSAVEDSLLV